MPIKCRALMAELEKLAPKHLAEEWDNVGLLVGNPEQLIHKAIVALDVDGDVVDEALTVGADMIVAHHPLIFKGIKNIRADLPLGSLLTKLIKNGIAVYAAHTNLDSAPGGVNDILAQKLKLTDIKALTSVHQDKLCKLVVFVPVSHVEKVRMTMSEAGAGHTGNYSHCSFATEGIGSFLPLAGTNPYIGKTGSLEFVPEYRLETIVPMHLKTQVINAMIAAHPYEEVAYDEYLLLNSGASYGLGRIGGLAEPVSLEMFIGQVKAALNITAVKAAGSVTTKITKVAVCGGSGADLIKNAVNAGADVLITGDVKYHEAQQAVAEGLAIIDAGHFATEQPVVECVASYLANFISKNGYSIEIIASASNRDIFTVY
ncbi:GTP cyclohydrolase 1 type 2 [Sporomusa rhizae]|uniref:Nif3-like dinuclear metal center hexameric protein n=1 Tax=Sporomusa rhizae TaxID=357999 RepID=UPI003529E242